MKAKKTEPEPRLHVTIRQGRKKEIVGSYMYFSIIDILRTFGADRQDAYDAAKWAGRATDGMEKTVVPNITMEIEYDEREPCV